MANFAYNTGIKEVADGTVDLISDTIKAMLCTSSYVADRDDDVVDAAGANDPVDHEINATNYTAGWGGAGRKTLGSKAWAVDKPNDRGEFDCADITWTALGNGTNDTISQMLIIKEGGADDTTSRLILRVDNPFPHTTNGGDLTLQVNAEGLLQLGTV